MVVTFSGAIEDIRERLRGLNKTFPEERSWAN
jgi:hypothetical protein